MNKTKTWVEAVNNWIDHGIVYLVRNDEQDSIEMTFDNGVYHNHVHSGTRKELGEGSSYYFRGMRDAMAVYVEHKMKEYPEYTATWIDPVEDSKDDLEGQGGIFLISRAK